MPLTIDPQNLRQASLIITSYKHWIGIDLIDPTLSTAAQAKALYEASFVVVSHGIENDPIFNYANESAQKLWELSWERFTQMPSKKSAEASVRDDRATLLNNLKNTGYSNAYRGTRISSTGRRFDIVNACVWNIIDENGTYQGQAAMFAQWEYL